MHEDHGHPGLHPAARGRIFRAALLCALATLSPVSPASAGGAEVSPRFEARATRACRGNALRLCPDRLYSEDAAANCPSTRRPRLTPACRRAYDAVARAVTR